MRTKNRHGCLPRSLPDVGRPLHAVRHAEMGSQVGLSRQNLVAHGTGGLAAVEAHVVRQRVADRERPATHGADVLLRSAGALLLPLLLRQGRQTWRRRRQRQAEQPTYRTGDSVTRRPTMSGKLGWLPLIIALVGYNGVVVKISENFFYLLTPQNRPTSI